MRLHKRELTRGLVVCLAMVGGCMGDEETGWVASGDAGAMSASGQLIMVDVAASTPLDAGQPNDVAVWITLLKDVYSYEDNYYGTSHSPSLSLRFSGTDVDYPEPNQELNPFSDGDEAKKSVLIKYKVLPEKTSYQDVNLVVNFTAATAPPMEEEPVASSPAPDPVPEPVPEQNNVCGNDDQQQKPKPAYKTPGVDDDETEQNTVADTDADTSPPADGNDNVVSDNLTIALKVSQSAGGYGTFTVLDNGGQPWDYLDYLLVGKENQITLEFTVNRDLDGLHRLQVGVDETRGSIGGGGKDSNEDGKDYVKFSVENLKQGKSFITMPLIINPYSALKGDTIVVSADLHQIKPFKELASYSKNLEVKQRANQQEFYLGKLRVMVEEHPSSSDSTSRSMTVSLTAHQTLDTVKECKGKPATPRGTCDEISYGWKLVVKAEDVNFSLVPLKNFDTHVVWDNAGEEVSIEFNEMQKGNSVKFQLYLNADDSGKLDGLMTQLLLYKPDEDRYDDFQWLKPLWD